MSVKLISSDNEDFTVDKAVAERSVLIKNMLEGKCHGIPRKEKLGAWYALGKTLMRSHWLDVGDSDAPIPLPNVNAKILRKVSCNTFFGRVKGLFDWRVSYNY